MDNSTATLIGLLDGLKLPISNESVKQELSIHPHAGSLLAFNEVLNNWKIENKGVAVLSDELETLPPPFIAHLKIAESNFAVVTEIDQEKVILNNEKWQNHRMPRGEFDLHYSGHAIVLNEIPSLNNKAYKRKKINEFFEAFRIPLVLCGFVVIFLLSITTKTAFLSDFLITNLITVILKATGIAVSILLLVQSFDTKNKFIKKVCSTIKNGNCNAILNSSAAKITKYLSWSEVGFFYFTGTFILFIFHTNSLSALTFLSILASLSLPYTFYSIYYQAYVAKQWCILCCAIQGILWLDFFSMANHLSLAFPQKDIIVDILISFGLPILILILIKPYIFQIKELSELSSQLRKFKFNYSLFESLLQKQEGYNFIAKNKSIIIGNEDSPNVITIVSNPLCTPCAEAHKTLEEWLSVKDDFQIQIIFETSIGGEDIAKHLISLSDHNDKSLIRKALDEWYKNKNVNSFKSEFPFNDKSLKTEFLIEHQEWCSLMNIAETPTIFLNGKKIPELYELHDLKYFI